MDYEGKASAEDRSKGSDNRKSHPRSLKTAERGIRTGSDFATFMSSLISDIISRRVTPDVGNAACNAGGKLLKVVEMQYRYGSPVGAPGENQLLLAPGLRQAE